MATQLGVINDALAMVEDREITQAELDGDLVEGARVMKSAWPQSVDYCLSAAPWVFASRIAELAAEGANESDPSIYAAPGYTRAWKAPADHFRTNWIKVHPTDRGPPPPHAYQDRYWHTNTSSLFLSYVSHDYRPPEHWPSLFANLVASYLAMKRGPRLRPASDLGVLAKIYDEALDAARTQDASEKPFAYRPTGSLVRARGGGSMWREQGWRY